MKNAAVLLHLEIDDNTTREQLIRDIDHFLRVEHYPNGGCVQKVIGFEPNSVKVFDPDKGRLVVQFK